MERVEQCQVCRGGENRRVGVNRAFGFPAALLECPTCGFSWLAERFSPAEAARFYRDRYRQMKGETLDRIRLAGDLVRARSQLRFFGPFLGGEPRILEIGAGYGVLAGHLEECGFPPVEAIEPDGAALQACGARAAAAGGAGGVGLPPGSFDLVILSHVLEHLADPARFLASLRGVLAPGGVLFLEVPNSLAPRVREERERSFHLSFFTPAHLAILLRRSGLERRRWGCFGKERFLGDLPKPAREEEAAAALADPGFDDIRAYPPDHPRACWLRVVAGPGGGREDEGGPHAGR